ncbi:unnamed protein product [Rhizophagus irregularis]|nr:unnamed protein product [Rhizophagus irregularis]
MTIISLKDFLKDFYQKIIDTNNYPFTFENILIEWIKNIDKNTNLILKLMQNHKESKLWFSSIIGFFYQYGIGCIIDKNKALEFYLLAINNKENNIIYQNFTNLCSLEDEFDDNILQNINVNIGKYLLSMFYYKDIILDKINLNKLECSESARKGDPIAQYNLGSCYQHGNGVIKDYNKALLWSK